MFGGAGCADWQSASGGLDAVPGGRRAEIVCVVFRFQGGEPPLKPSDTIEENEK
jgi:hypothetical protein